MIEVNIHKVFSTIPYASLDGDEFKYVRNVLEESCGYLDDQAQWAYAYQNGNWDGRVRLYHGRKNQFYIPTGLIPRFLSEFANDYPDLTRKKHMSVTDCRDIPVSSVTRLNSLDGIELRSYQEDMIQSIAKKPESPQILNRLDSKKSELCRSMVGVDTHLRMPGVGIWWSATGSGKTEASAGLIARLGVPTLFVVYGNDLVIQTWERFKKRLGTWLDRNDLSIGFAVEGDLDIEFITIAGATTLQTIMSGVESVQKKTKKTLKSLSGHIQNLSDPMMRTEASLALREFERLMGNLDQVDRIRRQVYTLQKAFPSRIKTINNLTNYPAKIKKAKEKQDELQAYLNSVDLLIFDEAHGVASKGHYKICMQCPAYYRVAMSGTPLDRADKSNLKIISAFGDPVVRITNAQMVTEGVVPDALICLESIKSSMRNYKWPECYEEGVIFHTERNNRIIEFCHVHKGKPILVMFKNIDHGEVLSDLAMESGLNALCIHGAFSTEERKEAIRLLATGRIDVLFASNVFTQGIDIPEVEVVINGAGGKAVIQVLQRLGRGLRGDKLTLIDFLDQHHPILRKHAKTRMEIYESQGCFKIQKN